MLKAEVFASFPNTVHSKADRVASPDAGEKIFYAAHEPRHLWMKEKSTHTAIYLDNPRRYKKGWLVFLMSGLGESDYFQLDEIEHMF